MPADPSADRDGARGLLAARLLIALAAVMWSTSGWFAKNPTFDVWPPEQRGLVLAFWRALFAGLLLLPLVRRPRWRPRLVPMAVCFAVMNGVFLGAMILTTAANTIWLQHTAPAWVFLLGLLLLGTRPTRDDVVLLVFAALGVGTILVFELRGAELVGVLLALLSGLTLAGVILFLRSLRGENGAWLISLNLLVTAALFAPLVAIWGAWPTPGQLLLLAAFGLFQIGLPYVLFAHGVRRVGSQEATGILLIEPLLVPLWVYLRWGEEPRWWTLAGATLILIGLAVRYLVPLWRRRDRQPIAAGPAGPGVKL